MTISSRLRESMKHAKFPSQAALARASGVPQPTINRILQGKGASGPELSTVIKLANACKVRAEWLMTGDGEDRVEKSVAAEGHNHAETGLRSGRIDPNILSALGVISEREAQVLSWYRMAPDSIKLVIEKTACAVGEAQLPPAIEN